MPPKKDYELGPGKLLWIGPNGETQYEIPSIPKLSLSGFDEETEETAPIFISPNYVGEITGTFKTNRKVFLRLLLGKSNNWLKMHGYPMIRKVRL